jgi:hypothetical protein
MTNDSSLTSLLQVDPEERDEAWEKSFLTALVSQKMNILTEDPQEGPDHWPYLMASTEDGDEPLAKVIEWLSTRGIGMAVNPHKPLPDFVLSYGMIWNFKERGEFLSTLSAPPVGRFEIAPGQQLWTGAPSEAHFPIYARAILKQFFMDQGVVAPKVLMISTDTSTDQKHFDMCFSLESLKSPPAHEHENIAEAISWFLPAHYSIALVSEKAVPGFAPL